ncbi:MAG: hypothetical protein IKF51_08885 [Solobacterium sp.]|nr:hypothetical protein [Solobacterium sp.]
MIFVTLGTNDKSFVRLLKAVEKLTASGVIRERVVVQAGFTKYESSRMEVFESVPADRFAALMDEADLIITHGGAGTIMTALRKGKKIIGVPRLAKYHEHVNDHQKQLLSAFEERGYLIYAKDPSMLEEAIQKAADFRPAGFESNTANLTAYLNDWIREN